MLLVLGLMEFGTDGGAKLAGIWKDNLKHGAGILVCGNGREIESDPLFLYDKPIHIEQTMTPARVSLVPAIVDDRSSTATEKASLQILAQQINAKLPNKEFKDVIFNTKTELKDECSPLDIPLHSVPEQTSFDFYILKVLSTLGDDFVSTDGTFFLEEEASDIT